MTDLDIGHYRRIAFEANRTVVDTPGWPAYQVKPKLVTPTDGEWFWHLSLVHYLTGQENVGKHHLFVEILSEIGSPVRTPFNTPVIVWDWEGRRPDERHDPFGPDKGINEPGANLQIHWGQKLQARIDLNGLQSDSITDVHTMWPDNQPGNTVGHHSCLAIWVKRQFRNPLPPEPEPEPPGPDPELPEPANWRLAIVDKRGFVAGYDQFQGGLPPNNTPVVVILRDGLIVGWRRLDG